jgi:3-oxoacyl-[acyl-carrier protein] reductase
MDLALVDKCALVTGSYRGTGMIIAQRLAEEGVRVFVHGLQPGQAEAAVAELGSGTPVTGDITTDEGADALAQQMLDANVDILVNNYGTADPGTWLTSDSAAWLLAYEKNVLSAQRMIKHLLGPMQQRGWGRIINLGTIGSTRPNARSPAYYASKGALATLTVSLAKEVAGSGVRVNLVSPGIILTPEVQAAYTERGRRKGWGSTWKEIEAVAAKDIPIRRITRREEVASLVAFLASPLADAIHAQNLKIDGGSLDVVS